MTDDEWLSRLVAAGGRAFPREDYQGDSAPGQSGMTLRDYFAAHALSIFANDTLRNAIDDAFPDLPTRDALAEFAYALADSMLKVRSK